MLAPVRSSQFKRDVKRVQKRGKDMTKLRTLLGLLIEQAPLPEAYQDHPLRGNWNGYRDAHIEPDWLLLYRTVDEVAACYRGEFRSCSISNSSASSSRFKWGNAPGLTQHSAFTHLFSECL